MIRPYPVVVAGRLLGAVVSLAKGWTFVPTDPVVADLQGQYFPSSEEAIRIAGLVLERAQAAPTSLPVLRPPPALNLVPKKDV